MSVFEIVTRRSFSFLKEKIEQGSAFLNMVGFSWCCLPNGRQGVIYLYPRKTSTGRGQYGKMEFFLSSLIARFIVNDFRDIILEDLVNHYYFYFKLDERKEITALARQSFKMGSCCSKQVIVQLIIENRIKEYLSTEGQHFNLEGFINFRLQDYQEELKKAVDNAVENFLMEKDYLELVRMLKYFLDLEAPKIDLIHLAVDKQGQFQITDQNFQRIDPGAWEEFRLEEISGDHDYEDLLVSMLVTVAPRWLLVHQNVLPRYPRAVDTIKKIFENRMAFCHDCPCCCRETVNLLKGD